MEVLLQLYWVFLKIGLFSFGGGYTMLPLIEAEIIRRGWLTTSEFVDIIAVAEMTPGTISVNSATFIGYNIGGIPGSLVATLGVITPSLILILFGSIILLRLKENPHGDSLLKGFRPAFIALVVIAAFFIGKDSLVDVPSALIFGALFILCFQQKISPFHIIAAGAVLGLILYPFH